MTNRFDCKTNLLGMSYAQFPPDQLGPGGDLFLKVVHMFGLAKVEWGVGDSGKDVKVNNLTLINFVLKFVGPTHEQTLTIYMMLIQVCVCVRMYVCTYTCTCRYVQCIYMYTYMYINDMIHVIQDDTYVYMYMYVHCMYMYY